MHLYGDFCADVQRRSQSNAHWFTGNNETECSRHFYKTFCYSVMYCGIVMCYGIVMYCGIVMC